MIKGIFAKKIPDLVLKYQTNIRDSPTEALRNDAKSGSGIRPEIIFISIFGTKDVPYKSKTVLALKK